MKSFSATLDRLNPIQTTLEEALKMVEAHADPNWKDAAMNHIKHICMTYNEFSTDDVWSGLDLLNISTPEPRAMGAVIQKAVRNGWCRPSGQYMKSERPECHSRPIRIMISNFNGSTYN